MVIYIYMYIICLRFSFFLYSSEPEVWVQATAFESHGITLLAAVGRLNGHSAADKAEVTRLHQPNFRG